MESQDSERIREIFDRIYETGALIIKPAEGKELARCQEDLHLMGVPQLPADVIEFLEIANGVAWNGFEFFGTYQVTVKKSGYTLRDIVTVNEEWHERKLGLANRLVLGTFDDDLFVYDPESRQYRSLDSMTLTEIDTCDSFAQLFILSVSACLDYDDEDPDNQAYD